MIRFLSVTLYLSHSYAIVQYLHNALASAPQGALLIIADHPYNKTANDEGFKELIKDDWETVDTFCFKRYPSRITWTTNPTTELWPKSSTVTKPFE